MLRLKTTGQLLFLAVAMAFFAFTSCNQPTPSETGEAHQQAIELTETMRLSHKGMEERLDFIKTESKQFRKQVEALKNPADSLENIVSLQDSLVKQFEGMCKEQKRLIDENENFIKKHEHRKMDDVQVAEQHRIIRENYEKLQLQAAAIVQEVENIKIRIDGATLTEDKPK